MSPQGVMTCKQASYIQPWIGSY